ncbi:MAG: hypothetical protein KF774_19410 [Planctomyces sp.]|nr:hypothetical protein [Planctomyces sp.]
MHAHPLTIRPGVAAALNFILPGAGLWRLGARSLAVLNFLAVIALAVVAWLYGGSALSENIHYVLLFLAAASAGLAHAAAMKAAASGPASSGSLPREV